MTDVKKALGAAFPMVLSASYAFLLVPSVFQLAGAPFVGVYFATVTVAFLGTLFMGVCRVPVLLAPSLAAAVFLVDIPILSRGMSWQVSLLVALVAAVAAVLLSFSKRAEAVVAGLPSCIVRGLGAGGGLMLVFYGGIVGNLVIRDPVSVITLADFTAPLPVFSFIGVLLLFALRAVRVRGAIPISMVVVALLSLAEGFWAISGAPFLLPEGLDRTALQFTLLNGWDTVPAGDYVNLFFFLLLFLVLGTRGSLAVLVPGGKGTERATRGIYALGALSTCLGAPFVLPAPESAAGLASEQGKAAGKSSSAASARHTAFASTGLLALFFFVEPVLEAVATSFPACLVPGLVGGGLCLLERTGNPFRHEDGTDADFAERATAGLLLFLLPVTRDIALSLAAGFLTFVFLKVMAGKGREVSWACRLIFIALLLYAFYGYWSMIL